MSFRGTLDIDIFQRAPNANQATFESLLWSAIPCEIIRKSTSKRPQGDFGNHVVGLRHSDIPDNEPAMPPSKCSGCSGEQNVDWASARSCACLCGLECSGLGRLDLACLVSGQNMFQNYSACRRWARAWSYKVPFFIAKVQPPRPLESRSILASESI